MEEDKIIIYQTEDGQTQIDVRLENETVWLTQAQMVELFQTTKRMPSSFLNVEQVIAKVLMSMHDDVPHPTKVQIKITNLDKRQIQLYQKIIR